MRRMLALILSLARATPRFKLYYLQDYWLSVNACLLMRVLLSKHYPFQPTSQISYSPKPSDYLSLAISLLNLIWWMYYQNVSNFYKPMQRIMIVAKTQVLSATLQLWAILISSHQQDFLSMLQHTHFHLKGECRTPSERSSILHKVWYTP